MGCSAWGWHCVADHDTQSISIWLRTPCYLGSFGGCYSQGCAMELGGRQLFDDTLWDDEIEVVPHAFLFFQKSMSQHFSCWGHTTQLPFSLKIHITPHLDGMPCALSPLKCSRCEQTHRQLWLENASDPTSDFTALAHVQWWWPQFPTIHGCGPSGLQVWVVLYLKTQPHLRTFPFPFPVTTIWWW